MSTLADDKIIEVAEVLLDLYRFYLFVTPNEIVVADLFPESAQPVSHDRAKRIALYGVLGEVVHSVRSADEDTPRRNTFDLCWRTIGTCSKEPCLTRFPENRF